jgi:hypothetical protein
MNANAVFDAASSFERGKVQDRPLCVSCHERSSLRVMVAELLYKNQLLRFKLSQSQALVGQLRLAFDQVQAHPGSATEIQGALNLISALLNSELEC